MNCRGHVLVWRWLVSTLLPFSFMCPLLDYVSDRRRSCSIWSILKYSEVSKMISKREENRYISRKFVCTVLTRLQGASILLRPNAKYIEHPDLFHIHSIYLPLFALRYFYFVSLCQYNAWGLHCLWHYWGECTESNWCYRSILGSVPPMYMIFEMSTGSFLLTEVFPIFRNPLDIIFYYWQVVIILCCCIFPWLTTNYHTRSSRPFCHFRTGENC